MSEAATKGVRWNSTDLEFLPENVGTRYEIIDGDLFTSRPFHWNHQQTCGNICIELESWSSSSGLGEAVVSPGIVFSESDDVIPDVVWISNERLAILLDDAGHLTGAPELVVEVLSAGTENVRRDKEAKLKLYSTRGVEEYWIADWRLQKVEVYRRENARLVLVETLMGDDELSSPLLPSFSCVVSRFFV
ncbi:Uma2 family endonuclease [Argonema antarcticum]|uniref:Uma2 family endonuclease n=1 Tax=Argonema antarcticum TaxID=2942763 RepID=UPI0020129254|nr:Uma2 family endonuclease [Argonema antarcticum]MCL1475042.1 Uma2 family endonuclease [Argonema antarcticum A004/B2]